MSPRTKEIMFVKYLIKKHQFFVCFVYLLSCVNWVWGGGVSAGLFSPGNTWIFIIMKPHVFSMFLWFTRVACFWTNGFKGPYILSQNCGPKVHQIITEKQCWNHDFSKPGFFRVWDVTYLRWACPKNGRLWSDRCPNLNHGERHCTKNGTSSPFSILSWRPFEMSWSKKVRPWSERRPNLNHGEGRFAKKCTSSQFLFLFLEPFGNELLRKCQALMLEVPQH